MVYTRVLIYFVTSKKFLFLINVVIIYIILLLNQNNKKNFQFNILYNRNCKNFLKIFLYYFLGVNYFFIF